jgi:hypothetical protein
MECHPYFDLWLHSTGELSALLSATVIERHTLHEWPLSCVQRITLDDGKKLIYKIQGREGIEPDFYARVESPLLPAYRTLDRLNNSVIMLFEFIDAPALRDLHLSEAEILCHGRALVEAVQGMPGSAPLYADLGSLDRWQRFVDETLAKLSILIAVEKFRVIRPEAVTRLATWAATHPVRAAFQGKITLTHADLSGGNVFLTPTGYKIIDWQFPRRLPDGYDLAVYLDFMGLDPYSYVDPAVVNIAWFIRVAWYVHSQADLFPELDRYEAFVLDYAERILAHKYN